MTITRKKLIEVALPLDAINAASAREKSIRHGHPSTLHLWWARRPLATARAVIFAQMVDDPSACPEAFPTEEAADAERQRLFRLLEQLVVWENTTNDIVLEQARAEIWTSWRRTCDDNKEHPRAAQLFDPAKLPGFCDPFAGGGALPLEAQRLGLEARASDLNPVAVLICKAMIEIPPKFVGRMPVNPESRRGRGSTAAVWKGAAGLAEDVRYYGAWMRGEAEKRSRDLYPKIKVTPEMAQERPDLKAQVGKDLTVIAWLWARTVKSPNPAYAHVDVPLASTFMLSTKLGKEAYVEPLVEGGGYRFTVKMGKPENAEATKNGTKLGRGSNFRCLISGVPVDGDYIKLEGQAGRLGARLMAVVAEGERGRVYLSPPPDHEAVAVQAQPEWMPEGDVPARLTGGTCVPYGLDQWGKLFTPRQLVALTTFSDVVQEVRRRVQIDAGASGLPDDHRGLEAGGNGATAYAEAIAVYLAFLVSQVANHSSSVCGWNSANAQMRSVFARQAIPMVWDYAESNPFSDSSGSFNNLFERQVKGFEALGTGIPGLAYQADAMTQTACTDRLVSTDPPYYDNIAYADLSDFFYVWLRRSLRPFFPDLFGTLAVPKAQELVAMSYRHGGKDKAEAFFLDGMTRAMQRLAEQAHPAFPVTIYYAFKQSENESDVGMASTGWETFLDAVIRAGFAVTGTWPVRTEKQGRVVGNEANALASSIVVVCRPRRLGAPTATRTEFLQELTLAMREALPILASGEVSPVDLAQASIGPGIAAYSKYSAVVRQDGKPVTVRDALADMNNAISTYRTERTSAFDQKTRFCVDFYDQFGFAPASYGDADNLARAKDVGVNVLEADQLLVAEAGKVWLVGMQSYPVGVAGLDRRFGGSAWEACMRLAATVEQEGESHAASLARELGEGICARARELAVWLYTIADARRRTQDAFAFNALDASWPEIQRLMAAMDRGGQQGRFA
jgi:putative DNA methylase